MLKEAFFDFGEGCILRECDRITANKLLDICFCKLPVEKGGAFSLERLAIDGEPFFMTWRWRLGVNFRAVLSELSESSGCDRDNCVE